VWFNGIVRQGPQEVHSTPEKFIEAMKSNHPAIAPSMLYAWASVTSACHLPTVRQT